MIFSGNQKYHSGIAKIVVLPGNEKLYQSQSVASSAQNPFNLIN